MATTVSAAPALHPLDPARLRVKLTYLWRHGRLPDLDDPRTFTERVQRRKLVDRDMRMPVFADKVRAKAIVADRLGPEWVIPTLWHGNTLPEREAWPRPFVVKARHGCNQIAFVNEGVCWERVRQRAERWVGQTYGTWLDEWLYTHIQRGVLVEPFVGIGRALPIDYKMFVFGGRVEFVQVHLDRGGRHRWIVFDRQWHRVSSQTDDADPEPPRALSAMIEGAEELGRGFDFVRVDLYEIRGRPMFGEMTFYPGSGLDRFDPVALDDVMGNAWHAAATSAYKQERATTLPVSARDPSWLPPRA